MLFRSDKGGGSTELPDVAEPYIPQPEPIVLREAPIRQPEPEPIRVRDPEPAYVSPAPQPESPPAASAPAREEELIPR